MLSEYTLKLIKLCHFFKKFLGETCHLNIQYTERSNYLPRLQYHYANMRPGATKGTLRRENGNSFFDVLCLIIFHWSFKKKLAFRSNF